MKTAFDRLSTSRNHGRATGLSVATLTLAFLASVSQADNTSAGSAHLLTPNTVQSECVATVDTNEFFYLQLFAGRSYEIWAYVPGTEFAIAGGAGLPGLEANMAVDDDNAFGSPIAVSQIRGVREGGPGTNTFNLSSIATFTAPTTNTYFVRLPTFYSTGCYKISLRETTMFSPWLSRAAGFEGFIELHNNTSDPVSVTLKGYNSTGALQGAGLTFSIPANATVFRTGAAIGVPVDVAVGLVLTHDGAYGSISGNITTLNGANGLSFDSPFTTRGDSLRQ